MCRFRNAPRNLPRSRLADLKAKQAGTQSYPLDECPRHLHHAISAASPISRPSKQAPSRTLWTNAPATYTTPFQPPRRSQGQTSRHPVVPFAQMLSPPTPRHFSRLADLKAKRAGTQSYSLHESLLHLLHAISANTIDSVDSAPNLISTLKARERWCVARAESGELVAQGDMSKDSGKRKRKLSVPTNDEESSGAALNYDVEDIRAKVNAGFDGEVTASKGRSLKSVKQILANENFDKIPPETPTYWSVEAPPSTKPAKKYCDLTGFSANYTDPKTRLRFCSPEAFRFIRSLPEHRVQEFLSIRQAETRLK